MILVTRPSSILPHLFHGQHKLHEAWWGQAWYFPHCQIDRSSTCYCSSTKERICLWILAGQTFVLHLRFQTRIDHNFWRPTEIFWGPKVHAFAYVYVYTHSVCRVTFHMVNVGTLYTRTITQICNYVTCTHNKVTAGHCGASMRCHRGENKCQKLVAHIVKPV